MTLSCATALEIAAVLCGPGVQIILPSFPIVSTANAVAPLGARPFGAETRPDTLNRDEMRFEAAIPEECENQRHIVSILLDDRAARDAAMAMRRWRCAR